MKRYLHVILFMILALSFVGVDAKGNTIYLKECEYTDEYKNWLTLSDKEKEKVIMPAMCKNNSKDKFGLVGNSSTNLGGSVTDARYDLREHGLVTSVKDQGASNSCWAFATNASIESNLLVNGKGTYDLSEAHLELSTQNTHNYNRLTFTRTIDTGGNSYLSASYLRNNWGPVLEATLPFSELLQSYEENIVIPESKVLNNKAMLDVNSIVEFGNSGSCNSDTIEDIKEYLITHGALTTTVNFSNFGSANLYQYYDGKEYTNENGEQVPANQRANHAVTIVGWDDNISKDSFNTSSKPTQNGAFIIKNSYGESVSESLVEIKEILYSANTEFFNSNGINSPSTIPNEFIVEIAKDVYDATDSQVQISGDNLVVTIGDNGYQYVSYDDVLVCNNVIGFFDVDTDVEENVYGYDDLGISSAGYISNLNKLYFASVFDKKSNKTEILEELNIHFADVGQEYKIYFADSDTKQILPDNLVAQGTSSFVGFHTIEINDAVITSDKFSIIVEVTDNEPIIVGVSTPISGDGDMWDDINIVEGVQFVSSDGITYADVSTGDQPFHLLIKAYTDEYNESLDDEVSDSGNNEEVVVPPEDNDDLNNNVPDDDNNQDSDAVVTPDEEVKPDGVVNPDKDNTNTDGKIEILPNEMNNNIPNNNNSDDVENPSTGDNGIVVLTVSIVILIISFLAYKKIQRVKYHN